MRDQAEVLQALEKKLLEARTEARFYTGHNAEALREQIGLLCRAVEQLLLFTELKEGAK